MSVIDKNYGLVHVNIEEALNYTSVKFPNDPKILLNLNLRSSEFYYYVEFVSTVLENVALYEGTLHKVLLLY